MKKLIFLSLALIPALCFGWEAKIIKVHDGDSIWAMHRDNKVVIRLEGIDAPEIGQSYGYESRNYLKGLLLNRTVNIVGEEKDRYGRTLATVYVTSKNPKGTLNINLQMIEQGYAWKYKNLPEAHIYSEAQKKAKSNKLGLWANNPKPPWDYRKEN